MKKWSDPFQYNCKNQNEGEVCKQSLLEFELMEVAMQKHGTLSHDVWD